MGVELVDLPAGVPVEVYDDGFDDEVFEWDAAVEALVAEVTAELDEGPGFTGWRAGLAERSVEELVAEIAGAERTSRAAQARVLGAVGELASRRIGVYMKNGVVAREEFTADHVALAVGVSVRSAHRRIDEALLVRERYPRTFAALAAGLIGLPGLRVVLAEASGVDDEGVVEVETRLLHEIGRPLGLRLGDLDVDAIAALPPAQVTVLAGHATPGRVERWVRKAVVAVDADAARARAQRAVRSAGVQLIPGSGDGMAWLGTYVPEEQALAGYRRVDDLARSRLRSGRNDTDGNDTDGNDTGGNDTEGIDQVRAQVFIDLLLGSGTGDAADGADAPAAPVNVQVLIDPDGVAHLGRLGPVLPATVTNLIALAQRTGGAVQARVVHPVTCPGSHPDGGTNDPYEPSAATRRTVQLRDLTCRFPGCTRPSQECELDHTVPWPHGPTCPCNLGALCTHHHRLKHEDPGWRLDNHGNGHFTWTTPWGTTYTVTP